MYQPGMTTDRQLAQIYAAGLVRGRNSLQEAADARADRQAQKTEPRPSARKLVLALAGAAPVALWITWVLIAH